VSYSVRAWDDEAQTRRVCVNDVQFEVTDLVGKLKGGYVFAIPDRQELRHFLRQDLQDVS